MDDEQWFIYNGSQRVNAAGFLPTVSSLEPGSCCHKKVGLAVGLEQSGRPEQRCPWDMASRLILDVQEGTQDTPGH